MSPAQPRAAFLLREPPRPLEHRDVKHRVNIPTAARQKIWLWIRKAARCRKGSSKACQCPFHGVRAGVRTCRHCNSTEPPRSASQRGAGFDAWGRLGLAIICLGVFGCRGQTPGLWISSLEQCRIVSGFVAKKGVTGCKDLAARSIIASCRASPA